MHRGERSCQIAHQDGDRVHACDVLTRPQLVTEESRRVSGHVAIRVAAIPFEACDHASQIAGHFGNVGGDVLRSTVSQIADLGRHRLDGIGDLVSLRVQTEPSGDFLRDPAIEHDQREPNGGGDQASGDGEQTTARSGGSFASSSLGRGSRTAPA